MLDAPPSTRQPTRADDEHEPLARRLVRCRACGGAVARVEGRVVVGSGELHTFVNPAGDVFELCCFRAASGARAWGEASLEFTWFPGYAWRFAHCRSCGAQLGWHYTGQQGLASFWGLIHRSLRWP